MRKELIYELEVTASADSIWAVYSSPDIPRILRDELLPGVFERLDVLQGNGGVGTVILIVFSDPATVPHSFKEKFTKIDHEKRLIEVPVIEGGYLDLGCTFYMSRIHVLEKGPNSCVIESTLIYEVPDELVAVAGPYLTLEPLVSMAQAIKNYVLKQLLDGQMQDSGTKIKGHRELELSSSGEKSKQEFKNMRKELTYELEVATSADSIWAVYSSPDIPRLLRDELLPGLFERLDVLHGNGGVGTVIHIVCSDPAMIPHSFKERFTKIDHEKRLMEVQVIEGGYLELGCTFYMSRIHVLPKGPNSCVIESTLIYEVPEELVEVAGPYLTLETLVSMAQVIAKYVLKQQFRMFGVAVKKPKLGLSSLVLFLILCLVILGGLSIRGV